MFRYLTTKLYETRGETVEWLNYFLEKIWRSIDPNIFVTVEDILEDTLESLAPSVIVSISFLVFCFEFRKGALFFYL